jgi:hypothetical protein
MVAQTQARMTDERSGDVRSIPVKAGVTIYQGSMVAILAGVAIAAIESAAINCLGRAESTVTGGAADGDVRIAVKAGVFQFANDAGDPIAASDIGANCYAADDQTVSKTDNAGARSVAGSIFDVDADGVWVRFS